MKIAKVIHHGQTRYRVNDPSGPDGKRQPKFFDTREPLKPTATIQTMPVTS